jgi:diguanylate cyclase (GGDEF)-like protein
VPRLGRTHEDRFQRHELDTLPSALVELDDALVVLRANRAAAALVGVPAGELEGAAFAGLVAPEGREGADACLRVLLRRSGPGSFDLDLVRARDREDGAGGAASLPVRVKVGAGGRRGDAALVLALEGRPAPPATNPAPVPEATPLDELPVAVMTVDPRGRIQAANPAAEVLLRVAPGALLGRPLDGVLPEGLGAGGLRHALRADDTTVPVDVSVRARDTPGGPGAQAVLVDASERLDATDALERRARRHDELAALGECALAGVTPPELLERAAGVLATGLEAELAAVLEVVPWQRRLAIRATVGWPAPPAGGGDLAVDGSFAGAALTAGRPITFDASTPEDEVPGLARLRAHGVAAGLAVAVGGPAAPFAVLVAAARSPRRFDGPEVAFVRDVGDVLAHAVRRARSTARLRHAVSHDALTGLPNRASLLERARRREHLGLLALDLDGFGTVNDLRGHDAGDELLCEVAERLGAAVRPGDTVARSGADEFLVLLQDVRTADEALAVVERVREAFATPFAGAAGVHHLTTSIGVAVGDGGRHADALLRDAGTALARARRCGGARAEVFDGELRRRRERRLQLAGELRAAVRRDELAVHFHPVVDLNAGEVAGFEALARWPRPAGGDVAPSEFLALAGEAGLLGDLGAAVLRRAARHGACWHARVGGTLSYGLSVNVAARQVCDGSILPAVREALSGSSLAPERLAVELTEPGPLADDPAAIATVERLRALGVRIVLDHFGTGWSSPAHLRRLPVDVVKVDRCFVDGLAGDAASRAIVAAVLAMAAAAGAEVVAAGVETEEQRIILTELGCRYAQGHLFARDLTAGEADALVRAEQLVPAAGRCEPPAPRP